MCWLFMTWSTPRWRRRKRLYSASMPRSTTHSPLKGPKFHATRLSPAWRRSASSRSSHVGAQLRAGQAYAVKTDDEEVGSQDGWAGKSLCQFLCQCFRRTWMTMTLLAIILVINGEGRNPEPVRDVAPIHRKKRGQSFWL